MQDMINTVQTGFELIKPRSKGVATLFYSSLFELGLSLQSLFPPDLSGRHTKSE